MARSPLTSAVLAEARQRPTRLLLTGLAVVVATLFTAGTFMFADTMRKGLELQAAVTPQGAAVVVESQGKPVDEDLLTQLRAVPGVAEATPVARRSVTVAKPGGTAEPGYWDINSDSGKGPLSRYSVVTGATPSGPGQVAVTENTAKATGLTVGAKLSLSAWGKKQATDVTVTGVVKGKGDRGSTLVGTPDTVKAVLGPQTTWEQVDIAAAPGSESTVLSAVRSAAGTEVSVRSGAEARAAEVKSALRVVDALFAILSVFTGVALVAAALVVASTFRIVVAQRRRRTALMRCVGATRGQVLRSLLFEAGLSGIAAGVVGVLAAVGLGYAGLAVAGNFTEEPLPPLQVSVTSLLLCVLLATVVTVIAALAPAVGGTRVPPIAALGAAKVTDAGQARFTRRMIFAALFTAAAVGLLLLPVGKEPMIALVAVAGSGLMAFFALIAAGPVIMPLLAKLLGGLVRLVGGTPGRLAVGNALRVPKRTANTTTVLTLGVVLVSAVLVGMSSIQASSADRLSSRYPAVVQVSSSGSSESGSGIDPKLAEKVRTLPETGTFSLVSRGEVKIGSSEVHVAGMDVAAYPPVARTNADEGSLKDLAPGTVAVSRTYAEKFGVKFGQTVAITGTGGQPVQAKVIAVYRGNAALGSAVLHPGDFAKVRPADKPKIMLVDPAAGVDKDKLKSAVRTALGNDTTLSVMAPGEEKAEMEKMFSTMTLIALGLVGMTVLVAVVGVAVTLSLSVVERTQENGLLRALGLTRGGMRATLAWEAVVFGACAAVLGLLLGSLYGSLGVRSLGEFDIISIPYGQLAVVGGGLLLLTLVAAVGPARRSARTSPLQALATD
ncbi:ABC transporter permease [Allokutzneria sp. NRRL B-24872]|uniref:ABC transporter permease n=1 Tax=Allokutzneria sp. NRRL B-24872 TaxID=1137961 RepID=UPI001178872E|nr:FtsX-like permease family protein [Allokutzneria sp. NRRL B-24872]